MGLTLLRGRDALLWLRDELRPGLDGEAWLREGDRLLREAAGAAAGRGRAPARRLLLAGRPGIWRHNRHGGLAGRLLGDGFWTPGRLQQEVALSEALRREGLPTPEVLLARAGRRGLRWRQDLVTAEVPGARTLFECRHEAGLLREGVRLLARLFEAGVEIPDLHPGNLLVDSDGRLWVIDLAGARRRPGPLEPARAEVRWQRFLRFFRKHAGQVPASLPERWSEARALA